MVNSLYKIAFSFGIILAMLSFKPCFIWLAPYTIWLWSRRLYKHNCFKPCFIWSAPYTIHKLETLCQWFVQVLNLVLSGRLLILIQFKERWWRNFHCFKPCFIWSAPYTIHKLETLCQWFVQVLNLVLSGQLLIRRNV